MKIKLTPQRQREKRATWHIAEKEDKTGPQVRCDNPLNLSISLSGGEETKKDSPSNGERKGTSPAPNLVPESMEECGV